MQNKQSISKSRQAKLWNLTNLSTCHLENLRRYWGSEVSALDPPVAAATFSNAPCKSARQLIATIRLLKWIVIVYDNIQICTYIHNRSNNIHNIHNLHHIRNIHNMHNIHNLQRATLGTTGRRPEARSALHCHAVWVWRRRFFRAFAPKRFEAWPSGSKSKKGGQEGPGARAR